MKDQNNRENKSLLTEKDFLKSLNAYAEELSKADGDYTDIFDRPGYGLEIIFDALLIWTFNVKVRRPWKFFGEETSEVNEVFQRSVRSHIANCHLAASLIEPKPDQLMAIEEELRYYNRDISTPEDVIWARSIYDWEESEGEYPVYLETRSLSASLYTTVSPDEDAALISRYIRGFEGQESELASIERRYQMFLDGASGEEPAWLDEVFLVGEPVVLLDGVVLSDEERRWILKAATDLLPDVY